MPKVKESVEEALSRLKNQFPGVFRVDKSVLFCVYCNCVVNHTKIFNVKQHIVTTKHKEAVESRTAATAHTQTLITEFKEQSNNSFDMDLCKAFLEANIPLKKVTHPSLKLFFEKYSSYSLPGETILRTKYLPILYNKCINELRAKASNEYIWVSLDETTDIEQKFVCNFIFGVLNNNEFERGKSYLLNISTIESVNASTIAAFFNDSLSLLWPNGIPYQRVLVVVTDAASYMLSAMRAMQTLYPKMLHLTCFAHGLHRMAEFVRSKFSSVNYLIANVKAVFLKAPSRRLEFQRMLPDLPLPPKPCIVRWGTWLKAAIYIAIYSENFDKIKSVIDTFDDEDVETIRVCKELFNSEAVKADIAYINCNFSFLVVSILKLQTQGIELTESLAVMELVDKNLGNLAQREYAEKLECIIKRNKGYEKLKNIKEILFNRSQTIDSYAQQLTPTELALFKYCPVTSVDVERPFSMYGNILTSKRRSFLFENLKQHLIIHCNRDTQNQ